MTRSAIWFLVVAQMLAIAGCSRQSDRAPDSPAASQPGPLPSASTWVVTPRGIGKIEAGMALAQANAALGRAIVVTNGADTSACAYVPIPAGPAGVSIMLERGVVARVNVDSGTVATSEGARIGDTEDRVEALYSGRIAVTPQKYTTGHYLTIRPTAAADSVFRIVFETDGRFVTQFRAGRMPAVSYVERCG